MTAADIDPRTAEGRMRRVAAILDAFISWKGRSDGWFNIDLKDGGEVEFMSSAAVTAIIALADERDRLAAELERVAGDAADLDAARAEAAALAAALREACVTLRSAAELREDIRDAYARHLRDVSERGNTVLADAGAAGERVQTLIQAARTIIITGSGEPHIVRWHPGADTRETVDVPLDQVRALSAALAALSAPAPARPDGEEGRADD